MAHLTNTKKAVPPILNKFMITFTTLLAIFAPVVAFKYSALGGVVFLSPLALCVLAQHFSPKISLYLSFLIGIITSSINLFFFYLLFGSMAFGLWGIMGGWLALFTVSASFAFRKFGIKAYAVVPFYWLFFEFLRGELNFLRFSWLSPGMALSHPNWNWLAAFGFYGSTFLVLIIVATLILWKTERKLATPLLSIAVVLILLTQIKPSSEEQKGPFISGIQLEFPHSELVLDGLNKLIKEKPETEIAVLSEYTFKDGVPAEFYSWCKQHQCYLVVGSVEIYKEKKNFMNTVFVISPEGKVVFKQGKSVPIQLFSDGIPAKSQEVWHSPWGKIGIAICYDLSYTEVMDNFVKKGAQLLIIPTMDVKDWGEQEHRLHSFVAPIRAKEYGVPIFRLASSGISQVINSQGQVTHYAPFPGQKEVIGDRVTLASKGSIPLVRQLFWLVALISLVSIIFSFFPNRKNKVEKPDTI